MEKLSKKRLITAFLLSPLISVIITNISWLLIKNGFSGLVNYVEWFSIAAFSVGALIFSYIGALILGVPAYFYLENNSYYKWWHTQIMAVLMFLGILILFSKSIFSNFYPPILFIIFSYISLGSFIFYNLTFKKLNKN